MDSLIEINSKLDALYEEYKKKGNNLSNGKSDEVVLLLAKLTGVPDSDTKTIAEQLSRFSAKICQEYFDTLTKTAKPSISLIDDLLRDFLTTADNSKQPQHNVKRFADTMVPIIKNYKEGVLESKVISSLVAYIAQYAVSSENAKEIFRNTVNKTDGAIYLLDFSGVDNNLMNNIWKVTNSVFEDLTKAKYESFIVEWAKKYGFIKEDSEYPASDEQAVKTEEVIASNEQPAQAAETMSSKEQDTIIAALTDMIAPLGKALESIQGEINNSRQIGAENVSLRAKTEDLERQLSEQRSKLQEVNQTLTAEEAENDELRKNISVLEGRIAELNNQLDDVYAINSRESSLEAEKIRTDLKKAFALLYEDWLEYEFSNVSEDNYESLQAIIKKIFRALERNGIDFKEKNQ